MRCRTLLPLLAFMVGVLIFIPESRNFAGILFALFLFLLMVVIVGGSSLQAGKSKKNKVDERSKDYVPDFAEPEDRKE